MIRETNFQLPGQIGEVTHGKVRDTYTVNSGEGELFVAVSSDRISAFDIVLPEPIPYKGQVLNQMSAVLLAATADVAPNWFLDMPDPNVTVGRKADPVKIELIMRAYLLGSAWSAYNEKGMRQLCDNVLPDGMKEFEPFDAPLFTPTTKAEQGDHDENITYKEIIERSLATPQEYERLVAMATGLFARGQAMAEARGLILADTKYEIGRLASGELFVIDEIHTPDSSRFFPKDTYTAYQLGETTERPEQLSKEFVREWLTAKGWGSKEAKAGLPPPPLPAKFISEVSTRYIDLSQRMLGQPFEPANDDNPVERVEANLTGYLETLSA